MDWGEFLAGVVVGAATCGVVAAIGVPLGLLFWAFDGAQPGELMSWVFVSMCGGGLGLTAFHVSPIGLRSWEGPPAGYAGFLAAVVALVLASHILWWL